MLERDEELLRARLAELADLRAVVKVLEWDMRVTMPSGGAERHGDLLGTMRRIEHERIGADDLGDLLDRAEQSAADEAAADLVRLARRDWDHVRLVPADLAGEIARAVGAPGRAPRPLGAGGAGGGVRGGGSRRYGGVAPGAAGR